MTLRLCKCCGRQATVVLKPSRRATSLEPTVVCHFCDLLGRWPSTARALGRTK